MPPPPSSARPRDADPRDRTARAPDEAAAAPVGGDSDATAAPTTAGGSRARPIVGGFHLRLRMGDSGRGGRRQRWSAAAAATAITSGVVALLVVVLADELALPAPASRAIELSPAEALRWVAIPATGAAGTEGVMSATPPAYMSAQVPPLFATPRDTGLGRGARGAVGPRRALPPPTSLDPRLQPAPDALPDRPPAVARGTLVLPGRLHACADGLCAELPGASGESGVMRRTGPPLTDARRDSLLRVMEDRIARATRMANENRPSNGTPPAGDNGGFGPTQQTGGGSISIGLPGGGPTAAERRRDSTAHAAGRRQIGRLDLRADSLRRDSVRRDSVRRATAGPRRAPE